MQEHAFWAIEAGMELQEQCPVPEAVCPDASEHGEFMQQFVRWIDTVGCSPPAIQI
jgi:hypothetical protein